jgi:hypothetical protein
MDGKGLASEMKEGRESVGNWDWRSWMRGEPVRMKLRGKLGG